MLGLETQDEISRAEDVRSKGDFAAALAIARQPLAEVRETTQDSPEVFKSLSETQLAYLASLARLVVSASDSLAKRTVDPQQAAQYLNTSLTDAVEPFYQNENFLARLAEVHQDGIGDNYYFLIEMMRDKAKLLTTAATLFPPAKAKELLTIAEKIWQSLEESLDENHPNQPFMAIEHQLFLDNIGQSIDLDKLQHDLIRLNEVEQKNSHRVATVAAWVLTLAKRQGDTELMQTAQEVFSARSVDHPELQQMLARKELLRGRFKSLMLQVRRIFVPVRLSAEKMDKLHSRMAQLGEYRIL